MKSKKKQTRTTKRATTSSRQKSAPTKPTQSKNNPITMFLAKINDTFMLGGQSTKSHTYAVYTDTKTKRVRAIPTTHLYTPDDKNMEKLAKGLLKKEKFAGYETPSGINNYFVTTNHSGDKLSLKDKNITLDKTPLTQSQAKRIVDFAKTERKNKGK